MSKTFGITITAKARHADLWEAAKKCGTAAELSRRLGLTPTEVGQWINLKKVPNHKDWTDERKQFTESLLFELTGKPLEEIWPEELRVAVASKTFRRAIEYTQTVTLNRLGHNQQERLMLPNPETLARQVEVKELLHELVDQLQPRYKEVIRLRYGLDGNGSRSLLEVSKILGVTRERVRQMQINAERKLQSLGYETPLADCYTDLTEEDS